jgi:small-conductance mechanosensitive channel
MDVFVNGLEHIVLPAAIIIGAALAGFGVYVLTVKMVQRLLQDSHRNVADAFGRHGKGPLRLLFPLLAVYLVLPLVRITPAADLTFRHALGILSIVMIAWLLSRGVLVISEFVLEKLSTADAPEMEARKIRTQVQFFKRLITAVITTVAIATILMTFDTVRQLGTTILASAGIAGIILGLAAQNTLGTLFAGLQIAVTQPFKIGDSVNVMGEVGTVEEITLTYVVVRTWDRRRLVIPIRYFIENSIQNMSMSSTDLLGSVMLYLDYSVPVDAIRSEFRRIIEQSPRWDRGVAVVHVTDLKERTVEVRALMSAATGGELFELRCEVREKLLVFLRENYPDCLPRIRAELREAAAAGDEHPNG